MKLSNASKREETVQSCGGCRYYAPFEDDGEIETEDGEAAITGYCRRYPPRYFPNIPTAISAWPEVAAKADWCGEFVPKL